MIARIWKRIEATRNRLRLHLSTLESTGQRALLGAVVGALTALVIILFRELISSIQGSFLPDGNAENHEALTTLQHFLLPAIGGLVVGLLFQAVPVRYRQVGGVHVMDRLAHHQGHLPLLNGVMQYLRSLRRTRGACHPRGDRGVLPPPKVASPRPAVINMPTLFDCIRNFRCSGSSRFT